jgi:FKBP-type peptidyl-prolyl cis-trans isomerase
MRAMSLLPSLRGRLRATAVAGLLTLIAGALVSACGAASNDNSGSLAGAQTSTTSAATCSTTGSGRTDDFKQAVDLQAPTASGLRIGDIVVGFGLPPQKGHTVTVQYTGWLSDGTMFDSSRQSSRTPFQFTLGHGDVIPGWDEGIATMKVGGVRRLVIPPALAYGANGYPPTIPANATLTFDVELLCAG